MLSQALGDAGLFKMEKGDRRRWSFGRDLRLQRPREGPFPQRRRAAGPGQAWGAGRVQQSSLRAEQQKGTDARGSKATGIFLTNVKGEGGRQLERCEEAPMRKALEGGRGGPRKRASSTSAAASASPGAAGPREPSGRSPGTPFFPGSKQEI